MPADCLEVLCCTLLLHVGLGCLLRPEGEVCNACVFMLETKQRY